LKPSHDCQNTCWLKTDLDHIEIHDPHSTFNATKSCISNCSDTAVANLIKYPLHYLSRGPELRLTLHVNHETSLINYFKCLAPLFRAEYELVHPLACGPALIPATKNGRIAFPMADHTTGHQDLALRGEGDLVCIWDLQVNPRKDIEFSFANFTFQSGGDCRKVSLEIRLPDQDETFFKQCDSLEENKKTKKKNNVPVLKAKKIPFGYVQIQFKMSKDEKDSSLKSLKSRGQFRLKWSEV